MKFAVALRYVVACVLALVLAAPALAAHDVVEYTDVVWASSEGFDLTLDILLPDTEIEKKTVLVIIHGGGWLINNKSIMSDLAHSVAARSDIIAVNINYRLLPDLDNTTTLNELVEDAMGAVLWVKENIQRYGGDPTKIEG